MKQLKVFFAGKVDPHSKFVSLFWRDEIVWELNSNLKNYRIVDSSLVEQRNLFVLNNNLPIETLFSQSCFYIQQSDLLVVNLTDDISVGGSQEIFIAKLFGIPVIGITPRGGKFNKLKYELGGKVYWNWQHPFVASLCDLVVQNTDELAGVIEEFERLPRSGLGSISAAISHYQYAAGAFDSSVNAILAYEGQPESLKQKIRVYFAGKMGKASGFSETAWRSNFSALITHKSHFQSVNLDFLQPSHPSVNENDSKLIFGRDAYLIRSSDAVIVNLSDDISVGGAIEMMLAKLYHRPLIGIARQNGKFVKADKDLFGRSVKGYVNPFVGATCDWLIHDPEQLPQAVNELHTSSIKSSQLIPSAAQWHKKNLLHADNPAKVLFAPA